MSVIQKAFDKGMQVIGQEHEEKEKQKLGFLRGGSGGLYQGGEFIGTCPRLAHLRSKGIQVEKPGYERQLMFQAGFGNEDLWLDVLTKGLPDSWTMKCEEDVPIAWETSNGTKVTGRPDIVLFEGEEAQVGIELKLVSSLWTARDVGFQLKPKLDHLIQAGHYSWKLGVPFELWYTSRADFAVGSTWEQNTFPKVDEMPDWMLSRIETSIRKDKRSGKERTVIKKILPFMQGYELSWHDRGQLQWRPIGHQEIDWQYSPVTQQGIEAFYEYVSTMETLGPRPSNYDANGDKASWSKCDYCPLDEVCKGYTNNSPVDKWRRAILKSHAI